MYLNHTYVWTDVEVLDYSTESHKFKVKVLQNNQIKEVYKLSLIMNFEKEENFQNRLFVAKNLFSNALDDQRYLSYILGQPDAQIQTMSSNQLQTIQSKSLINHKKVKTDKLLQEIQEHYNQHMKKCIVLKQMLKPDQAQHFEEQRLSIRKFLKYYPFFGTIKGEVTHYHYMFNRTSEEVFLLNQLQKIHISKFISVVNTLDQICNRSISYEKNYLYNTKLASHNLPMNLSDFESLQKQYHKEQFQTLLMQWREYLVSEIQDSLRETYRFYQTDQKQYSESELKKLLKRIDFMFNTFVRENIFKSNIRNWCNFIKQFNTPNYEEDCYTRNDYPLLNINLIVNTNYNQQKKKKKEDPDDPVLYYEPNLSQIISALQFPINQISESSENFIIMEKDLVPLVDVPKVAVFLASTEQKTQQEAIEFIQTQCEIGLQEPKDILQRFSKYSFLYERTQKSITKNLFGDSKDIIIIDTIDIEKVDRELQEYIKSRNQIERLSVSQKNTGFFKVNTKQAKEAFYNRCNELLKFILQKVFFQNQVSDICMENVQRIQQNYEDMYNEIKKFPKNEKELVQLKSVINAHEKNINKNEKSTRCIDTFLELLSDYNFQYPDEEQRIFWSLGDYPREIREAVNEGERVAASQEIKFMDVLDIEKDKFARELMNHQNLFVEIKKFNNYLNVKEYAIQTNHLKELIDKSYNQLKSFNEREVIFKQPISEYHDLNELNTHFDPFYRMWEYCIEYDIDKQDWTQGSFLKLNYTQIEHKMKTYLNQALRLSKQFAEKCEDDASEIAQRFIEDIGEFRKNMWIIELLSTEVMIKKPQYWKEFFEKIEKTAIEPNDDMCLRNLIEIDIFSVREQVEEFSNRVEKQFSLERKMNEMIDNLRQIKLQIMPYKTTFVLQGLDDITQLLDDQFNILIFMKSSPYIKPILRRAEDLEKRLLIIQDTLEGWIKCQRSWMYLEPIFASDDIKSKMALEHQKFVAIDKSFRGVMEHFNKDPHLWDNIDSDKTKNDFDQNNKTLDAIQKSLSEYLETKRRAFPRFYFLSDDQLLEILAQTKDPTLVQRHVNKCFEAINLLDFNDKEEVCGMISPEKEMVEFTKKIDVNEGDKKGNVEIWLHEIEMEMKHTLKEISKRSLADKQPRVQWIVFYQAMIVLMGIMIQWTEQTENALKKSVTEPDSIKQLFGILQKDLSNVVDMVRGELPELQRLTLSALVVLDVHNKDIIESFMNQNIQSPLEFAWLSQLRYYPVEARSKFEVKVKCINAVQQYGFEYLGNSTRLVITPLTDRCYRTLIGAYHLFYGGAPEGPAGTGKTETTKDLAKAVAMQCVVFNCSDQLNFQAMNKFFKGLASSGAWCCFDEFNRIDLEVLSVIAQQVVTIQNAIKMKALRFEFDGDEIELVNTCTVNITMNPGYAGRSELPDNLKALFRTVAMMVPDYSLIAQNYLYSVGFQDARNLARKIVSSLRLSSEQLSSQFHYDFGMRALKAILTAAGDLKRKLDYKEDILALIALMDVNLPKFTLNDIPLFKSITSDLFPGITLPDRDQEKLISAIQQSCEQKNWIAQPEYITKCIQLFDTIMVRHGLMLVGEASCGKSTIIEGLKMAMCKLSNEPGYNKVDTFKLNPKSIMSHQLYGLFDNDTKTWTDGVLPKIMRDLAQLGDLQERKWVVFDGPVDAVWIENMNTVLDDNKKLCLTSQETIKLTKWMTMMFEVEDLQHASPATVSRCGMVFLEGKNLKWSSIVETFFLTKIPSILEKNKEFMNNCIIKVLDAGLAYISKYGKFPMTYSQISLVKTFLTYLKSYLDPYEQGQKPPKDFEEVFQQYVIFSTLWSLGAILEETVRPAFSTFFQELIKGDSVADQYKLDLVFDSTPMSLKSKMQNDNLFDQLYDAKKATWLNWMQTQPTYIPKPEAHYHDLVVPTIDSIRNAYLLNILVNQNQHMLLTGPTGTGKTVNIINELNVNYYNEKYTNLVTAFSGQTTCNQVQRSIESKMNSRRGKGRFGPEDRKERIVIFIDDLNMPAKETYLAQPPIEILRQWMDEGGWYDLESMEFKFMDNIIFLGAMGPPSQGRQSVTMRYTRHFNILYVEPFQPNSLYRIFNSIMDWYFMNKGKDMMKAVQSLSDRLVNSTIEIFNLIKNSKELLPTPAKSHYIYNLRDISKVFQGIVKASHVGCRSEKEMISLWSHECLRVFHDRLINLEDQQFFCRQLETLIKNNFKFSWGDICETQPLLWANFIPVLYPNDDTSKKPLTDIYCHIPDFDLLTSHCNTLLKEYNTLYSNQRMDLILFMNAIEHVIRIVRVLQTPLGHGLLVGVGGSGRKSLATLSSFIVAYEVLQVDAKQWVDELQKVLKIVGLEQRPVVFIFNDTQVLREDMYEDIGHLLNNGEIPNLFPLEEKAKIVEEISSQMPIGTMNQKYAYFVSRCKENLHLLLCMSPVGEGFRRRIRTFPGLVNCTTIDWFLSWPNEALKSTAIQSMQDVIIHGQDETQSIQTKESIVELCVDMQVRLRQLTLKFISEYRRYYYITPTSYLELLAIFKRIHSSRSEDVLKQIQRYENGLEKIKNTEITVHEMQEKLESLQPILKEKTEQNQKMLANLQIKQKEASEQRAVCEEEEAQTNVQREEANELKHSCEEELGQVLPLLHKASQALDKIKQEDITTIKSFITPPVTLDLLMQGICIAMGEDTAVKWKYKDAGDPGKGKEQDFWDYSKRKLLNNTLIGKIKSFNEEKIKGMNPKSISRLKTLLAHTDLQHDRVAKVSEPAANLLVWINACVSTFGALLVVEPKRKQLVEAENRLKEAEATLAVKQEALKQVMDLLQSLEDEYNKAKKEKEDLEHQVENCSKQLERAEKLLTGLGGEKISWKNKMIQNKESLKSITGDVILSSGIIAYLGAFFHSYRESCVTAWQEILTNGNIPFTPQFTLANIMSNENTIGIWVNSEKLPNDAFSIENAIILKNSSRWPLLIDPQMQANIWIREMVGKKEIRIIRPNQPVNELMFLLENAITFGQQVLLENIGEEVDQLFDPILQNKKVKQGGQWRLKMGEKIIDYSNDFKFFMTTKLANPHYTPEICVKVTLLNFMVTLDGLEDQMLNIVVKMEEPKKEEQRQQNIKEFFDNKNKQKHTEDKILQLMSEATGNILENEDLINTLQQSKIESNEIEERLKQQEINREQFKNLQNFYKDSAKRASNLYFSVADLQLIEPVYSFSLEFYIQIFESSIEKAIPGRVERVKNINTMFTSMLYGNVVRSLLEKDKLTFSLMLCIRIMQEEKKMINLQEVRYLMVGGIGNKQYGDQERGGRGWLSDRQWACVEELGENIPVYQTIDQNLELWKKDGEWYTIFESEEPIKEIWCDSWEEKLNIFQKLLLLRIIRPDKFVPAIQFMISEQMGENFIEIPPFDLVQSFEDSNPFKPIIFVLSPGADPRVEVENLAHMMQMNSNLIIRSLGQGQGKYAEDAINNAVVEGQWVFLQNCHLAASFMPSLERIFENIPETCNPDFRLWLTTAPSNVFPVSILQKSIKLTYEPPKGIKNSLLRSYLKFEPKWFEDSNKPSIFKRLLFGLCFFHALVLERRKFGPLGWNIPYEFSAADLAISILQLKIFLDDYEEIQWPALNYIVAEANYGGRVTEDKDRRLITIILKQFFRPEVLVDNYAYSSSGIYYCPSDGNLATYQEYIRSLPINNTPEVFGMHDNVQISSSINQTNNYCNTILSLLPRVSSGSGGSSEDMIKAKIETFLQEIPKPFPVDDIAKRYPILYEQSMNTVLQQELIRYNRMIVRVRETLATLGKAIDGLVVMSSELEALYHSLLDNKVPALWEKVAYPSLKNLGSWIIDFLKRLAFMQKWVDEGAPASFWISGFYFTQSFLTGVLQNFARKYQEAIDTLAFDMQCIPKKNSDMDVSEAPENGCYIYGLYLDGCRWNDEAQYIDEQEPKVLYYEMCYIYLVPKTEAPVETQRYSCPVYKTSARKGVLTTIGLSNNYVMNILLPISEHHSSQHWIIRGVALLTQLDD